MITDNGKKIRDVPLRSDNVIEMKASDYEKAAAEILGSWSHSPVCGDFWTDVDERAHEIAAARISRAEFERDRMGETGERNAAARQASEPEEKSILPAIIPSWQETFLAFKKAHANQASEPARGDQTALDIACDAYNSVPQDGNGAEEAPMQAALAAAFPALTADCDRLAADLAEAKRDAERYRWLKVEDRKSFVNGLPRGYSLATISWRNLANQICALGPDDDLDALIDAAARNKP